MELQCALCGDPRPKPPRLYPAVVVIDGNSLCGRCWLNHKKKAANSRTDFETRKEIMKEAVVAGLSPLPPSPGGDLERPDSEDNIVSLDAYRNHRRPQDDHG